MEQSRNKERQQRKHSVASRSCPQGQPWWCAHPQKYRTHPHWLLYSWPPRDAMEPTPLHQSRAWCDAAACAGVAAQSSSVLIPDRIILSKLAVQPVCTPVSWCAHCAGNSCCLQIRQTRVASIIFAETESWVPAEPAAPWVQSKTQKEQKWLWGKNLGYLRPRLSWLEENVTLVWVTLKVKGISSHC